MDMLLDQIARNIAAGGLHYFAVAIGFSVLYVSLRYWKDIRKKIQARQVEARQLRREIATTVLSLLIFGSILPIAFALGFGEYTDIYRSPASRGWPYFVLSIVFMIAIQDTYFYWTHRLMHARLLFRWFHRTHHLSINVNPWTTYSLAPLEALVASGSSVLIVFLVPVSGLALLIFATMNTAYAVYSHLGYELYPRGTAQHWLGRWINTSVAHNTHHARARHNYGGYFLFWDRCMGTIDPDYAARYRAAVP